jgi:hypothetical protein
VRGGDKSLKKPEGGVKAKNYPKNGTTDRIASLILKSKKI